MSSFSSMKAGSVAEAARERALLQVLQRELDRLEEERIQLKTDNRSDMIDFEQQQTGFCVRILSR
jgi:hypothetical protein